VLREKGLSDIELKWVRDDGVEDERKEPLLEQSRGSKGNRHRSRENSCEGQMEEQGRLW
jgi:hypothetical protein